MSGSTILLTAGDTRAGDDEATRHGGAYRSSDTAGGVAP